MLRITGIVLACLFFIAPAEARQHHKHHAVHHRHHAVARKTAAAQPAMFASWWNQSTVYYSPPQKTHAAYTDAIVSHPAGCPSRAFCGCGAAVRLGFGAQARSLWLAANWFKFPRTAPAPGMVAVRRHHVMVLEADLGGGVWQVYDANSGGHATRIHARSIAGYAVVNPRA